MVNEERLRHMIKLAQFDENEGKRCKPMEQYARKDYVSLQLLISFVTGTISYGIVLGMWVLHSIDQVFELINGMELKSLLVSLIVSFVLFMTLYLGATYIVFQMKYTEGRRAVKKYYASIKKVNQMYEREDKLKSSSRAEWD